MQEDNNETLEITEEKKEEKKKEKVEEKKSGKSLTFIFTVIVIAIVFFGVLSNLNRAVTQKSVEESVEQAIEQSTGGEAQVDISKGGEEITVETEEGSFTAGSQEIPEDFPDDIPIYSGSKVLNTISTEEGNTIILQSNDTLDEIVDFYKTNLENNGWKITTTTKMANAVVMGMDKGKMSGALVINETDEGTQITIEVTEKEE